MNKETKLQFGAMVSLLKGHYKDTSIFGKQLIQLKEDNKGETTWHILN